MLSESQLKLFAETLANIGLLFFASMVVPFFTGVQLAIGHIFSGLIISTGFWIAALSLIKTVK